MMFCFPQKRVLSRDFLIAGLLVISFFSPLVANSQGLGGIRGSIQDQDFEVPLAEAKVTIVETGQEVIASETGNFVFNGVAPGNYTLLFSKAGYTRQIKSGVIVSSGSLSDVEMALAGEIYEMEEFVVQNLDLGGASEIGLLNLRMDSSALMDSVGADLISRAGAGDAASALKLVSGTTVQDGKYAVVRGLPDRYVVSMLNGVRLPTADPDKRAVQLDQFPSSLIESVRVLKSFTPDQQGDASGGTVDVILKGLPDERVLNFSIGTSYNENHGGDDFLSYDTSENNYWGQRDYDPPPDLGSALDPDPQTIPGSTGVRPKSQPFNYSWDVEVGDRVEFEVFGEEISVGGIATFGYEQKAGYKKSISDKYAAIGPGSEMEPFLSGSDNLRFTELYDITESTQERNWNGAVGIGLEHELLKLNFLRVFTHNAEDKVVQSVDTRGRAFFAPQFIDSVDGSDFSLNVAPYQISESLIYKERDTESDQLGGELTIPIPDLDLKVVEFKRPVLDWKVSRNSSSLIEPNKRIIEHYWLPGQEIREDDPDYDWEDGLGADFSGGQSILNNFASSSAWLNPFTNSSGEVSAPPPLPQTFFDDWGFLEDLLPLFGLSFPQNGWFNDDVNPDGVTPGVVTGIGPGSFFGKEPGEQLGNFQQVWKKVVEESEQYAFNYKWDFEDWMANEGYIKAGLFHDNVDRAFRIQSLSNKSQGVPGSGNPIFSGEWEDVVGDLFAQGFDAGLPNTTVFASRADVGYDGLQELDAWYWMAEIPVSSFLSFRGGIRHESFKLQTRLIADPGGEPSVVKPGEALGQLEELPDGSGFVEDADYERVDNLPSFGFDFKPTENLTFRANWAKTVAKQQFKEVVPVLTREYPGAPGFAGNSDLRASPVDNMDLRLDYTPYPGGLISCSFFQKDIEDPIEYYQATDGGGNTYTFVSNYPSATVEGWEFEVRQDLGRFVSVLEGLSVGGNYTLIEGDLDLGGGESGDMMQLPEYLYNIFCTYDLGYRDIKLGLFYTEQGETLQANKDQGGNVPAIYALPYGTLNFSLSGKLSENVSLSFKAKNLLDPEIEKVYREDGFEDAVHTSHKNGREYSVSLKYAF